MADKTTVARPYAKAAFEEANGNKQLGPWSEALHEAATVVQDPRVHGLLGNPAVSDAQLAQLVIDLAGPELNEPGRNFVQTLAQNRRLGYLPEISTLFDALKDEAEGMIDVTVTSAVPLEKGQRETLSAALQRRLKRHVRLHCKTDPTLIGGAVLRAGDLVIDGSLRSRLDRIAHELTS
jgi:F-type H+-transporting ATPase subunit delta